MAQPVIVDLGHIYRPDADHGFTYEGVGRPSDPRWRDGGPTVIEEEATENSDSAMREQQCWPASD